MKLEFCHVGEAALARPDRNDIWFALLWILQNISQQQKGNDFTNLSYCCTMRRPVFDYIIWILHLKRVWLVELVVKWLWRSGWKAGHPKTATQRHTRLAYPVRPAHAKGTMSSLARGGSHFHLIIGEEERASEERARGKRVTWSSSVQVRSISPRRPKLVCGGPLGDPALPVVGLLSTSRVKELEENKDKKEKANTLVTLRMLSQSTKALVGQLSWAKRTRWCIVVKYRNKNANV